MIKLSAWIVALPLLFAGGAAAAESLKLADCLALARQQNPTLQTAGVATQTARERVTQARSAYLPRVDLDAGYTLQKDPQQVIFGSLTQPTQDRRYTHFNLSADQLLYDFGRTAGKVGAAEAAVKAAEFGYAGREQDILLQTVAAYYRVLSAGHLLGAAWDEAAQMTEHLRVAESFFQEGLVTRNDVLQAEVRLAASRQLQEARDGELNNAWLQLNYLTGRAAEARGDLDPAPVMDLAAVPAGSSEEGRPELQAQRQQVTITGEQVRQARGGFWPRLYARLGADYVDNSYVKEQTIYAATLGLRVNLYEGDASSARLRETLQAKLQEERRLNDLQRQVRLEEESARNDAAVAARRIATAETAIVQAEENLRINRDRYQEQVGTATEVIDAQTLLTQTRTDFVRAQFEYQVAVARVLRAAGRL